MTNQKGSIKITFLVIIVALVAALVYVVGVPKSERNGIVPKDVNKGILTGKVTIGPTCPVESDDAPCPPPASETYTVREVIIYANDGKTPISRSHLNPDGTYFFELPAGEYVINTPEEPVGGGVNLPQTVRVRSGQTTKFDFEIDTGIR